MPHFNRAQSIMNLARCLQHVPFEGPAAFAPILTSLGYQIETHLVPRDGLPPNPGDLVLVMGGPMSANDPDPWIEEEIAFICRAVDAGIPMLGVCLGSQLLARAVGGSVYRGPTFEIGMMEIDQTAAGQTDPCLASLPDPLPVFEWHGEGIDVPNACEILASSTSFPVQAFRAGPRAYGLIFHLEVTASTIDALCDECPQDIATATSSAEEIRRRALPQLPELNDRAATFLTALLGV